MSAATARTALGTTVWAPNPNRCTGEREAVWFAATDAADYQQATANPDAPHSVVAYADSVARAYVADGGQATNGHTVSERGPWPPRRMALYEVQCECGFSCTVLGRDTDLIRRAHTAAMHRA